LSPAIRVALFHTPEPMPGRDPIFVGIAARWSLGLLQSMTSDLQNSRDQRIAALGHRHTWGGREVFGLRHADRRQHVFVIGQGLLLEISQFILWKLKVPDIEAKSSHPARNAAICYKASFMQITDNYGGVMDLIRVNEEELTFNDDQRLHNGIPFTGIGYEAYSDSRLKREATYYDGFQEGLVQEWFPNGNLKCQWHAEHGRAVGNLLNWHENGVLYSKAEYEFGVKISYREWNNNGTLIIDEQIDPSSKMYQYVLRMRETHASQQGQH
jgi:hypothetical protein